MAEPEAGVDVFRDTLLRYVAFTSEALALASLQLPPGAASHSGGPCNPRR